MNLRLNFSIAQAALVVAVALSGCASNTPTPNLSAAPEAAPSEAPKDVPATPVTRDPERKDAAPKADVTCTKKDDVRVLTIDEVRGGCWMMYVNKGIKKRTAWSKKGNGHCEKVRDQIRGSLRKSGYTCK